MLDFDELGGSMTGIVLHLLGRGPPHKICLVLIHKQCIFHVRKVHACFSRVGNLASRSKCIFCVTSTTAFTHTDTRHFSYFFPPFLLKDPRLISRTRKLIDPVFLAHLLALMDFGQHSPISSSSNDQSPPVEVPSNGSTSSHKRRAGRKKFRETRHPVFRGVRQRGSGKWVCEVREPSKKSRIWLGTFACPEMAARAHDVAALALRGRAAVLNFPESAWRLPRAESSLPKDIQRAAAKVAEAFSSSPVKSSSKFTRDDDDDHDDEGVSTPDQVFLDDEALFNMPSLLANMAEGLLIPPPTMQNELNWDDMDCHMDLSLWSEE